MNKAFLLIGGNQGDRRFYTDQAMLNIERYCGKIVRRSSLYETAAWGKTDQPAFFNRALQIETALDAHALMAAVLQVEESLGRKRTVKYGPRTIDIDILFFNEAIIDEPALRIPHPELPNRRFVLAPMDEIAPGLIHPVLHKTIHRLLLECPDPLDVKKI